MSMTWSLWIAAAPSAAAAGVAPLGMNPLLALWLQGAGVVIALFGLLKLVPDFTQWRARKKLERSSEFYTQEQLERATRYYVPPDCSNLDPSNEAEPGNLYAVKESLFGAIDRFLSKKSTDRHLLLLADSGMGKSACLINYYVGNQKKWGRRRHRIALVPLGIPNADDLIEKIERKNETVLFLDAFDEDTKAIKDHRGRLDQLMKRSAEFRRVVMTCRTQFFLKEEEIPRETGILRVEPREAGRGGGYEFWLLYLAPLSDQQVEAFLRKRFGFFRSEKREKARSLVSAVPSLSVRPMLLAFIPDLLESGREPAKNRSEVYRALINAWYEREKTWVDPKNLQQFSEQLAVDLFVRRAERGAERISAAELTLLAERWNVQLEGWQLTGRSLLNRDAAGNFKFAHRSVMEYLVAKQVLEENKAAVEAEWTDEVGRFIEEAWGLSEALGSRMEGRNFLRIQEVFAELESLSYLKLTEPVSTGQFISVFAVRRLLSPQESRILGGLAKTALWSGSVDNEIATTLPRTLGRMKYMVVGGRNPATMETDPREAWFFTSDSCGGRMILVGSRGHGDFLIALGPARESWTVRTLGPVLMARKRPSEG